MRGRQTDIGERGREQCRQSGFSLVWVQRPEPQAGEGANETVETIHTGKWNTARGSAQFTLMMRGRSGESQAVALASSKPTALGGCGIGCGRLRPLYFFHTSAKSSVAAASCILMMAFGE